MTMKLRENTPSIKQYAVDLIRRQFVQSRARTIATRQLALQVGVAKSYDWPDDRRQCVWADMYDLLIAHVNPLWAVRYEVEQAFLRNRDVNARVLVSEKRVAEYSLAGLRFMQEQRCGVITTLYCLTDKLGVTQTLLGTRDTETVLMYLSSTTPLDPVVELLWRQLGRVSASKPLIVAARMAYASGPELYADLSTAWLDKYGLRAIFRKEVMTDGSEQAFAAVGLSTAIGAALQRSAAT